MSSRAAGDRQRRQTLLSLIHSQQDAIRAQLTDGANGLIPLEQRLDLEAELEALVQNGDRLEALLQNATTRIVVKDETKHKPLLVDTKTGENEQKVTMDLTGDDLVALPSRAFKRQQNSPNRPGKKLKREPSAVVQVEIDLTLESEDEKKPIAKSKQKEEEHNEPTGPSRSVSSADLCSPSHDSIIRVSPSPPTLTVLPELIEPDIEDTKPVVELDVVELGHSGSSRMAGEERVRKLLFRIKREDEDGEFEMDDSCKKCLGEDVVIPENQRCTASREALGQVFGGNQQLTCPVVSKDVDFEHVKKGSWLICSKSSYNPDMPRVPGQHGVMMGYNDARGICPVFVCLSENSWLYLGNYLVFGQAFLPRAVWQQVPETTKRTWASNIPCKSWGKRWMQGLPAEQHNQQGIFDAFDTGQLKMCITVVKCVGYDLDIVSAVGEAQKEWINGIEVTARRHAQIRKWLVTKGGEWLGTTRAGQEWLEDDPTGQRFAQMSVAERRRWANDLVQPGRTRRTATNTAATRSGPSTGIRRRTRHARRSPSSDSVASEESGRHSSGRISDASRKPVARTKGKEPEREYEEVSDTDYEPSDLDW